MEGATNRLSRKVTKARISGKPKDYDKAKDAAAFAMAEEILMGKGDRKILRFYAQSLRTMSMAKNAALSRKRKEAL